MSDEVPWEGKCVDAAWAFGKQCRELKKSNPYDLVALDWIMSALMTELWDNDFSQSEIRSAFEKAVQGIPGYAAGYEKRSDGPD